MGRGTTTEAESQGNAWRRGTRDRSNRSPLQGGEHATAVPSHDPGEPRDRHLRIGVSHPSGDPTRHRVFEVRATFDAAAGGWVARLGEQNLNEQLAGWGPQLTDGGQARAFPTAAACLGDAVTSLVAEVDQDAAKPVSGGTGTP